MLDIKDSFSNLPEADSQQSLIVFDSPDTSIIEDSRLFEMLKRRNVHIVVISKNFSFPESLQKTISDKLLRGIVTIDIQPLSTIHITQRVVHSIFRHHNLAPSVTEQETFEKLAEFTTGSPAIVDVVSSLLDLHLEQEDSIQSFADNVHLSELGPSTKPPSQPHAGQLLSPQYSGTVRLINKCVYDTLKTVNESENIWTTSSHYDSWQVITVLIEQCKLTPEEQMLLHCLSVFNCSPIPAILITELAMMICKASHKPYLASTLHTKLQSIKLLKLYPKPIVFHPKLRQENISDTEFFYVPKFIAEALWKDTMSGTDKAMSLATLYNAFQSVLRQSPSHIEQLFLLGLCSLLVESCELYFELIGKNCYQQVYRFFLKLQHQVSSHDNKI